MVARQTVLFLGDVTVAGDRPVSELALVNPAYDDPQADCKIWNIQTQTWQDLTPGTNTNSLVPGSDRWSFEARFREAIRDQYPTGTFWVLKYGVSSGLRDWEAGYAGNAYALAITQLTNAATAAVGGGDTLDIVGVVVSIQTADFRLSTRHAYGDQLKAMIDSLLTQVATIPGCTLGTIRVDGDSTPVVIVEPHYAYLTPLDADKAGLQICRMQAQGLENREDRVAVVRTHNTTSSDNLTFSTGSMIAVGMSIGEALFPATAFDDSANADARMVLVLGDELVEGTNETLFPGAGDIASLPTHLQGSLSGVRIWNPYAGVFQTMQVGVNNQISLPGAQQGYGPEVTLADELRGSGDVWLIKGTALGAFGSLFLGQSLVPLFGRVTSWPPQARRQWWDMAVRGWLVSAIDSIRHFSAKAPKLELVVLCFGSNDLRFPDHCTPEDVPLLVESAVQQIKDLLVNLGITTIPKFAVCVPSVTGYETMSDSLQAVVDRVDDIVTVPMLQFPTLDGFNLTATGTQQFGRALYEVWKAGVASSVQPLFVPSMTELRKALRLSRLGQDNDAVAMIDSAEQAVKAGFFQYLGETKIAQIQAIAYTKAPKTNADFLRVLAANTEVKWVRSQLMRTMPLMFMDGASTVQTWNEEAAFREGSFLQTRDELRRLDEEIKQNLSMLQSAVIEGASNITVSLVTPESSISPGETVFNVF